MSLTIDLKTEVDTRWRKLPVLEAELPGTVEDSALIGTNYKLAGPFGQGYALNPPPIPPLAPIHQLVKVDADAARHITVGWLWLQ